MASLRVRSAISSPLVSVSILLVLCIAAFFVMSSDAAGPRPGGRTSIPTDDADLLKVVEFAVNDLNARSNSIYKFELKTIHRAEVQVVAGLNYYLTLELHVPQTARVSTHEIVVYKDLSQKMTVSSHRVIH